MNLVMKLIILKQTEAIQIRMMWSIKWNKNNSNNWAANQNKMDLTKFLKN